MVSGRDGAGVKHALGTLDIEDLKLRANRFLADPDSFPPGDKSLSNFISPRTLARYARELVKPHVNAPPLRFPSDLEREKKNGNPI